MMKLEMKNPETASAWLAMATLVAVVLQPPEAYGTGRMILVLGSTFAFLLIALDARVPFGYLAGGVAGMLLLVAHSVFLSRDVYRSIEFLTLAWSYYSLFGALYFARTDPRKPTALTLALGGTLVAVYGIYQYFFGLEAMYNFVFYSGAAEAVRVPILNRVASARVFSTFALPGTLWGFTILTLPLHALFWTRGRPWRNRAIVVNAAAIVFVTVLTQSIGVAFGFFALAVAWWATRKSTTMERAFIAKAALVAVPAGAVGTTIYLLRSATHNPVQLRLENWLSAWEMWISNPLGSGLNTYAVLYLQHQQLGSNETQFAHNTPVQLLGELGLVGLALGAMAAAWLAGRTAVWRDPSPERRWILIAVLVWTAHNLIDINVYFGSIGAVGAALLAMLMWEPPGDTNPLEPVPAGPSARKGPRRGPVVWASAGLAAVVIVISGGMFLSSELLHRARVEIEQQKLAEAATTLETAAAINPFDSGIFHEAGQVSLELYHGTQDRFRLDDAQRYFARAIRLSPRKVGPHTGLALSLSSESRVDEALRELRIAQQLHPAGTQTSVIRRLIERRRAEIAREAALNAP
jgi:tetratricopeptide (TPR) repeat protein